jgi:two-component system cell cycle response regulator DivK
MKMNHKTILVVEDHEDTRFLLKVVLERKGYRVVEAENGMEAIGLAECERPGLILMDVRLPTLDGLSAIRHLRGQDSLRLLPIVAISAHAAPRDQINAMSAGCNAYLTKPIDFVQLNKLLHHYFPVCNHSA